VNQVTIRPARRDDLPKILAIEESGAETFEQAGIPLADGSPPEGPEHWAPMLDAGLMWIADDAKDGPIGFVAGSVQGDSLYIEEVDVVMERQKQGHGARLMRHAVDQAKARGLASVTLTTFRNVAWNAPFYAKLGFVELAPAEQPAFLAAHLAEEASRGFDDRCGMRLAL
jgi:predicted N-acetyltransferase YhbS